MAGCGFEGDFALVIADDFLDDGQAETGSVVFSLGDEGIEERVVERGVDAGAGVLEAQNEGFVFEFGADGEGSAVGHGVGGVAGQVEDGAHDFAFVDADFAAVAQIDHELNVACSEFGGEEFADIFHELVDEDVAQQDVGFAASEQEEFAGEFIDLVELFDGVGGVLFADVFVVGFGHELHVAGDHGKGRFVVVQNAGDHLSDAGQAVFFFFGFAPAACDDGRGDLGGDQGEDFYVIVGDAVGAAFASGLDEVEDFERADAGLVVKERDCEHVVDRHALGAACGAGDEAAIAVAAQVGFAGLDDLFGDRVARGEQARVEKKGSVWTALVEDVHPALIALDQGEGGGLSLDELEGFAGDRVDQAFQIVGLVEFTLDIVEQIEFGDFVLELFLYGEQFVGGILRIDRCGHRLGKRGVRL